MADQDLEERLNSEYPRLHNPQNESDLEKKVKKSDWNLKTILWDVAKYLPLGILNYALVGAASLLTPIGLGFGKLIVNRKKKKKTTWAEMRKTLAVANFGGTLAYWAYSIPDLILGQPISLAGKILKTVLFNPIMVAPWIGWYRATSYIVDKYGGWGMIKSFFNFKIFKYVKEAYDNDLKKKFFPTVLEAFLTISPIHFYSMNYVDNATYRVGIGAINDILFSMISGEEGLLKTIHRKITGKKKENIVPSYSPAPAYAPAQPYRMAA